jgi:hypothetical protein
MARQHGIILTYVRSFDQLEDAIRRGGYDTLKVVTGWGIDGSAGGWSQANMQRALKLVSHVIVRTVAGDPSASPPGSGKTDFLDPDTVEREIAPWYALRHDIMIELGNEPNARWDGDERYIWKWRYFLEQAIQRCRKVFPEASIMPGGLMFGKNNPRRWFEILREPYADCDMIAIHAYEFYSFAAGAPAYTNQLREALDLCREFCPDQDLYLTEYGINDRSTITNEQRGARYAAMLHFDEADPVLPANLKGAVYYHLALEGDHDMQAYHLYPHGDDGYRSRFGNSGPPAPAPALRPKKKLPTAAWRRDLPAETPLIGPSTGPIEKAVAYIKANLKPGSEYANDVEVILGYYWSFAPKVGLDPFIMACQMIFETDSLNSQWAGRPRRNPAGLGVRQGAGLSFATWELSVQAHLGHLLALALTDNAANAEQLAMMQKNPRHANIEAAHRGAAKTVAALGGVWSPNPEYGKNLITRVNQVLA